MGEKPAPLFGTARGRDRHLPDAELARLLAQCAAEVEADRPGPAKAFGDFGTYLIALTANPNPAMHYDIARLRRRVARERCDAPREDAAGTPAPAGMQQRNRTGLRNGEVDRNTVGDRHREQDTALRRGVAVAAIEDQPSRGKRLVPAHVRPMDLM